MPSLVKRIPPAVGDEIARRLAPTEFDVVVVMRTFLAGAAVPFVEAGVPAILDADDDEVRANRSLAKPGIDEPGEAERYAAFQRTVFPWFEHVLFAARDDAVRPFGHLPNAVRLPVAWATRPAADPLELLFVGDVGYDPNRDAVDRLTTGILPAIARMGVDAHLLRPSPDEAVGPFYERAHMAVVPLRAGAGTSIKILEAFAHGCPVVSTPTGARGLDVTDGEQLIVTPDDDATQAFAAAVVALGRDDERRTRLAGAARRFVVDHHDADVIGERLARLVDQTRRSGPATLRGRS
jgi:glycosyltransferase involved in cell wall biosynthesis